MITSNCSINRNNLGSRRVATDHLLLLFLFLLLLLLSLFLVHFLRLFLVVLGVEQLVHGDGLVAALLAATSFF